MRCSPHSPLSPGSIFRRRKFRAEIRKFFDQDYPKDILAKNRAGHSLSKDDHLRSQRALQNRGWYALTWPKEYGGPGWSAQQRYIFDAELERAGAPAVIAMGVIYLGPLVCAYGTPWQKQNWLTATLNSEIFWAQGYSEPNSGSDLASLGMRAERIGEDYVVNGQKTWTSQAHWADWIFCLARTSQEERKQGGISIICVPMDAPGVSVRPIIDIDRSHYLNSVFFDNVKVPAAYRIGEEGRGWGLAKFVLNNERLSYAHISRKRNDLKLLKAMARDLLVAKGHNGPLPEEFATKIAAYEIGLDGLEMSVLRVLTGALAGTRATSRLKIEATESAQALTELFVELASYHGARYGDDAVDHQHSAHSWVSSYLFNRAQTIYGGTTEVQKGVIAKELVGGL